MPAAADDSGERQLGSSELSASSSGRSSCTFSF